MAYLTLPDGKCLNEILLAEGFAKPMNEYFCSKLQLFQDLNCTARLESKGLYAISSIFKMFTLCLPRNEKCTVKINLQCIWTTLSGP